MHLITPTIEVGFLFENLKSTFLGATELNNSDCHNREPTKILGVNSHSI